MIKNFFKNTLFNFFFLLFSISILITFIWIGSIQYYFENKIVNEIKLEIKHNININKNNIINIIKNKYNKNIGIILKSKNKNLFIKKIGKNFNFFQLLNKTNYKIITYNNKIYIYLTFYITYNGNIYEIKKIKKISSKIINEIKKEKKEIILIILSFIIFLIFTIYPLVLNQYKKLLKQKNDLIKTNISILKTLGNTIAKRDKETQAHNYRVVIYTTKLAEKLRYSKEKIQKIIKGSLLHDIGKIAIPDNILLKKGKLNNHEIEIMKTHVIHGINIIEKMDWLKDAKDIVQNHHEKCNGKGYPLGLIKNEIPEEAKLFTIIDIFDALTSKRSYKEAYTLKKAKKILFEYKNELDKDLLLFFNKNIDEIYNNIYNKNEKELEKIFDNLIKNYFFQ